MYHWCGILYSILLLHVNFILEFSFSVFAVYDSDEVYQSMDVDLVFIRQQTSKNLHSPSQ
jgi:hypothetical protein